MFVGDCLYLLLLIIPFVPVVSVPASVADGFHPHRQSAARGFVWPHTMMVVMVVPASEVEASSSRCADHVVMDGQSVTC